MKNIFKPRVTTTVMGLLAALVLLMSHMLNPQNGTTGAPGDGLCQDCHAQSQSVGGVVNVYGIPTTVVAGNSYNITVSVKKTLGAPSRGGFQAVVLNGQQNNVGSFSSPGTRVTFTTVGTRVYAEHNNGAKFFNAADSVVYTFVWTAPSATANTNFTMYVSALLSNGDGTVAGDYTATTTRSFNMTQAPLTPSLSVTNPTCNLNNGSILVAVVGGIPPFSFQWNDGAINTFRTNLASGTYTLTVTDSYGQVATTTATLVMASTLPSVAISASAPAITCANTASILTATGGDTYLWDNGASGATRAVTAAGIYAVTATNSGGCTSATAIMIDEDVASPNVNLDAASGTSLSCALPTLPLNAQGGMSYLWSNGANSANINVSVAGTYTVTITAQNGCTSSKSIAISSTSAPVAAGITATNNGILSCTNPSLTLTATGGVAYAWSGGGTGATRDVQSAGVYTVTATAANGCTGTSSFTVTANLTAPNVILQPTATLSCSNGTVNLATTTNATTPTYSWSAGATPLGIGNSAFVTVVGVYTVTVLSANGCSATGSTTVISESGGPAITVSASNPTLNCTNPTSTLSATSPTGVFYLWTPGVITSTRVVTAPGTYTVTVSGLNGCTSTASIAVGGSVTPPQAAVSVVSQGTCGQIGQLQATGGGTYLWSNGATTASITNMAAGTYTVTVTAANACTATSSAAIIGGGATPTVTTTVVGAVCNTGGSIAATGGGTYLWSNGATTATVTNLGAGTYTVTVTATVGGCTSSKTAVMTSTTPAPTSLVAQALCNPNRVKLTWAGPTTGSYQVRYRIANGTWSSVINIGAVLTYTTPALQASTAYNFQVRYRCPGSSPISAWVTKNKTTQNCMTIGEISDFDTSEGFDAPRMTATPNPAGYVMQVQLTGRPTIGQLRLIEVSSGKTVLSQAATADSFGVTQAFDVSHIPAGLYSLLFIGDDQSRCVEKVIITR